MKRPSPEGNFESQPRENKRLYSVEDLENDAKLPEIIAALTTFLKSRKIPNRGAFDIEDIIQETLEIARKKFQQVKDPGNIIPWLCTIASRKLIVETYRNRDNNRDNHDLDTVDQVHFGREEDILKSIIDKQKINAILKKMEELYKDKPIDIELWKMRFLEDLDYATIEKKLNLTEAALRLKILRMNQKILSSLGYEKLKKNKSGQK